MCCVNHFLSMSCSSTILCVFILLILTLVVVWYVSAAGGVFVCPGATVCHVLSRFCCERQWCGGGGSSCGGVFDLFVVVYYDI
jgi:hypothetical protein